MRLEIKVRVLDGTQRLNDNNPSETVRGACFPNVQEAGAATSRSQAPHEPKGGWGTMYRAGATNLTDEKSPCNR